MNIETIKQENTSFIKEDTDIEKIIQRVNENKKKYGFESTTEDKQKKGRIILILNRKAMLK